MLMNIFWQGLLFQPPCQVYLSWCCPIAASGSPGATIIMGKGSAALTA